MARETRKAEALLAALEAAQQAVDPAADAIGPGETQRVRVKLSVCVQAVRAVLQAPAPAPTAPAPVAPPDQQKGGGQ